MRTGTVSYKLEDLKKGVIIPIGFVGENDFTRVIFDAEEIYKKFPNASVSMKVQPPKGVIYPATVTRDGNDVTWQVKEADVANRGGGELQLTFTDGETKIKTYIARTDVKRSLAGNGPAPDPVQDWVDNAEEVLDDLAAMDNIAKTAEAGDVGKALSPKTVENGVVTEWQFVEPGAGTDDYADLDNKPSIAGVTLSGNKTLEDLGIAADDDLDNLADDVSDVKTAIHGITDGKETFSRYGTFVNGNLAAGVVYTNVKYRVTTNTIMTFTRALEITIAEGFRFLWNVFVNGSYSSNSDWQTGTVIIPANTSIKVLIARVTEDETETADINTFLSKIVFNTVIQDELENLEKDVTALGTEIDQKTDFVEFVTDPNFEDSTNIASDTTWQDGYYRSTAGNATSSQYTTNYTCSDFIPVKSGEKYRLYVNGTCTVITEYYTKAKNDGTEVSLGVVSQGASVDITVPDGKTFLALNCLMNHSNKVNVIHRLTQYDNEKNISFPRLVYGTQEWIGKKIVNFGDSVFDNGQTINEDISTYLTQLTGATVLNCAFGGCRMGAHTASQFDAFSMYKLADAISTGDWTAQDEALNGENIPGNFATTLARLKAIDFSTVDIVTISYGTNDFAGGLGLGGSSKYFTDWALDYSIKTIMSEYPNVRIFVCLPIYRVWLTEQYAFDEDSNTKEVTTWTGGDIKHKLTDFIEAEREVCKANQIPVIDNYYDLGVNKWNWLTYYPSNDGTHPKIEGRKLIAKHIASVIW